MSSEPSASQAPVECELREFVAPSLFRGTAPALADLAVCLGALAAAPLYSDTGGFAAVLLGFVVPFYVWMELFSATLYFQRTPIRNSLVHGRDRWVCIRARLSSMHAARSVPCGT